MMRDEAADMNVTIIRGAEAEALLATERFRAEWDGLCDACPWATPYQAPACAATWYATYRASYEPLLVLSQTGDASLQGLLPLAVSRGSGELVVAGAWQAEYQCWIAPAGLGEAFGRSAISAVRKMLPRNRLTFRYMPPGTPTTFLAAPQSRNLCLLQRQRRPLLRFEDGAAIAASLKKSGNKRRIRDLRNLGGLRFERVTDPAQLDICLDQIIAFHDLRHMAIRGSAPFRNDPVKKLFNRALMNEPAVTHVCALMAGDQIAAAHVGAIGRKTLHLGLIAHNPLLARHSPGKFLTYYLAQMLMADGYEQIDLTPGGDAYKERFANAWDEIHSLTVFPSRRAQVVGRAAAGVRQAAKQALAMCRVTPHQVKAQLDAFRHSSVPATLSTLAGRIARGVHAHQEVQVYRLELHEVGEQPPQPDEIRRDGLEGLLSCPLNEVTGPSRQLFISAVLRRLEMGQHVYTCVENGRLLHICWLAEPALDSRLADHLKDVGLPAGSGVVLDACTADEARGRGLEAASLLTMMRDASRTSALQRLFVLAETPHGAAAAQRVGGTNEGKLIIRRRAGRVRQQYIPRPMREPVPESAPAAAASIPIIKESYLNPGGAK